MNENKATSQLKEPPAAARPLPMMMQAVANGSVRGRAAWSQTENFSSDVILDVMVTVITESYCIR